MTIVLSSLAYPHHDKNFCHGHGHRGPIRHARWPPRHSVHDLDRKHTYRLPGHSVRAGTVVHRFLLYANPYIRRSPRRVRFSSPDIISSDRHRWVHCPLVLLISHLPIVTVGSPVFLISAVRPPLITLPPSNVSAAPLRTTSILRRTYIREIPLCRDKTFIMASP